MTKQLGLRHRAGRAAKYVMIAGLAAGPTAGFGQDTGIDLSQWSPEYIRSIAGTAKFDTAGDCAKITPLDHAGKVSVWWTGPNDASRSLEWARNR